jgi:hypothetical protein
MDADEAPWIASDCEYHQVVGIVNTSNKTILLWNYGEWLLPARDLTLEETILAVRIVSRGVNCLSLSEEEEGAVYSWRGMALRLNQWTRSETPSTLTLRENKRTIFQPLRSLFSSTPCPAAASHRLYRPDGEHLPDDSIPDVCDEVEVEEARSEATITICVGGCHMSAMPCSGVGETTIRLLLTSLKLFHTCPGVARCLRAQMTTTVKLIAVDHNADGLSGATDFCFDQSHSLFGTADSRNDDYLGEEEEEDRVGVTELKQFDTLVNMLRQFGADPQTSLVFYLP